MKARLYCTCLLCFYLFQGFAQSLQHPVIWTTEGKRADVLKLIEDYDWAQDVVNQIKNRISSHLSSHQSNPTGFLTAIPDLATDDNLTEAQASSASASHHRILISAAEAGLLYFLYGNQAHAQFATDIITHYAEELALRSPSSTSISGNAFYDPRTSYPHFAVAYDFVYPFLKKTGTMTNRENGTAVPFDNAIAQKAIINIVGNVLQEYGAPDTHGKTVSNHPVLTAPGALFPILCVEDDTERERLFDVFWNKGTKHQNSFTKTILPMFGEQGIWPEPISYSFMPNVTLILNIVDRIKPELNAVEDNLHVLDGVFLFDNLRNPDRRFVRYGDSKRNNDATETLYRYTLNLAQRTGMKDYIDKANIALRKAFDAKGGYQPSIPNGQFDNYFSYSHLLWGVPVPDSVAGDIDFEKPTVIIKHAGVALQRNYVDEDNVNYGLCGIIGGAHYVHSHATGIAMELYGAGYVMAPNGGLAKTLADRKLPEHRGYFWRHAGNNTMIVNGTTHGIQDGAWNSNSDLWMNTTVNVAAEPKHLADPGNPNFNFATQFLADEVNNCEQQRTLSTIRTSSTTAYYFDMFRSKSLGVNNFHDYIYHNVGDATTILDENGQSLSVSPTSRYQTDIGDTHKSPGWRFFENTEVTSERDDATRVRFDINFDNRAMHLFLPAGVTREYTKAIGPPTREAKNGYVSKKTQIMAIRQRGEAWDKPYVVILEPSIGQHSSVQSVEHLYTGTSIVGAKVTSQVGSQEIVDYVICNEDNSGHFELEDIGLSFKGHFAVARVIAENNEQDTVLYVGEGSYLAFGDKQADRVLNVKHESKVDIQVFPNPARDILNVAVAAGQLGYYRLFDLSGVVMNKGVISGATVIDIRHTESGVYLLEVTIGNIRSIQKIIIED